ncbi:MAG: hypothetical protein SFZ03_11385 [Candidatus Melainabacteria bacterium]|nr:hypothetical protein [Candidatus Melainabacteria bacterium]
MLTQSATSIPMATSARRHPAANPAVTPAVAQASPGPRFGHRYWMTGTAEEVDEAVQYIRKQAKGKFSVMALEYDRRTAGFYRGDNPDNLKDVTIRTGKKDVALGVVKKASNAVWSAFMFPLRPLHNMKNVSETVKTATDLIYVFGTIFVPIFHLCHLALVPTILGELLAEVFSSKIHPSGRELYKAKEIVKQHEQGNFDLEKGQFLKD